MPFSWFIAEARQEGAETTAKAPKEGHAPLKTGRWKSKRGQPKTQNHTSNQLEISGIGFPRLGFQFDMTRTLEKFSQQDLGELTKWRLQQHNYGSKQT